MSTNGSGNVRSIEATYQKKTQLEHILLRPDTYIGSVEPVTEQMWVFDEESEKMVQRQVTFVPGLYKIFDEILVNAADNKQRDNKMDCIKININREKNEISVWNNGMGIPVQMHKDEKMYVPTMIFGHLLTSSNYNDEEAKVTGGRNGYGAKLCNIFSKKFTVETSYKKNKQKFKQTWTDNMSKAGDVKIGDCEQDYTKITFQPDLSKFKMQELDKDIVDLMSRRAYDVAASTGGVKVYLNDKKVPVKNFKDYVDLCIRGKEDEIGNPIKMVHEKVGDRWEVACTISDHGFQQISFVNSIATTKGGRHVDYIADMLVKQLAEVIKKKNKGGMNVKPFQIKNHMWVFINCLIVNPTFDSQTKENMTLQAKSFGSKCALSEKFIGNVLKSGITEAVISWAKFKAQTQLEKIGGKKTNKIRGIPKLEDANEAGKRNAQKCTLILTEGDSAKSLAVSGLGVVGRDFYGVFPLRGKLLNVREATHKQILENAEINNILKIVGLKYKTKYNTVDDLKSLRYGKIMIMTDQDQDGSHIKGLLINFLHHNWPELLRLPFLEEFITPIVKATKKNVSLSFYSIPEFEEWKKATANNHTYNIKYYKGLGTSTSKEAKEYFENMARHRIRFKHSGVMDDSAITMAFSKKHVEQRKEWLTNWMEECKRRKEMDLPEVYLYEKDTKSINFSEFVNKELVLFSNADNERSIPSMMDGLKPGQRKVMFTCIKRNDKREIKVAQLAGSVAEHSAYHHGEASLMSTIINLAQNYVGSNNINILLPNGQFGTRLQGGKDAASPRYIFTMLNPVSKEIFNKNDEPLLTAQMEDNQKIEPLYYVPIIPTVLVNGSDGIGTGWSTKVPNFNPREIVDNIRRMIRGEEPTTMKPWYKNFKGTIELVGHQRYLVNGEVNIIDDNTIEITELPVGTWTQVYKESVLEPMLNGGDKTPSLITEYKEYNTDTTVRFVVSMTDANFSKFENEGFHKVFKLQTFITTSTMVLFDENGVLTKFDHVNEILHRFFHLRLDYYGKRKDYMLGFLRAEAKKLSNQARFILEKCDGTLTIENKKKKAMISELVSRKFDSDPLKAWQKDTNKLDTNEEAEGEEVEDGGPDFNYLLGMVMWNLTLEKKEEILKKRDEKLAEVALLESKTPAILWEDDLEKFLVELAAQEAREQEDDAIGVKKMKPKAGTGRMKMLAPEALPSPKGRRVEPVVDADLRKKIEKAVAMKEKEKENKAKGLAPRGRVKKEQAEPEDEFDNILAGVKPLEQRIGNSPEAIERKLQAKRKELKQSKLDLKPKKSKNTEFDPSDEDDSEGYKSPSNTPPSRAVPRRNIAKPKKYNFDESDFSSDEEGQNGICSSPEPAPQRQRAFSSSDSDTAVTPKKVPPPKQNVSSSDLFDELMGGGSGGGGSGDKQDSEPICVESSPEKARSPSPPPKKAAAKPRAKTTKPKPSKPKASPKAKPGKRKLQKNTSDSDEEVFQKKHTKKKHDLSSNEDMSDNEVLPPREKVSGGRARKPVSYKIAVSSEDDMSDF